MLLSFGLSIDWSVKHSRPGFAAVAGRPPAVAVTVTVTARKAGLGLEPASSAIVSVQVENAAEKLAASGIRAAARDGRLRASFHLYDTEEDVDLALAALATAGLRLSL
jgi:selenocysteine lyase/cysteine desulfurase